MTTPVPYRYWRMDKHLTSRYQIPEQILGNSNDVLQVLATPEFGYRWEGFRFASSLRATPADFGEGLLAGVGNLAIRAYCITRTSPVQQVICCKEKENAPNPDAFDWRFYIDTDDKLKFDNGSVVLESWFPVVDGLGHQFAVLHEGDALKLMADGLVVDSAASESITSTDGPFFYIGNRHGGGYSFKGVIESVELWSGGVTSADLVADLFLDTTLSVEPVDPVNEQINVSPSLDTQLQFFLRDEINTPVQLSLDVNVLTPGYEKQMVVDGGAEPDFVLTWDATPTDGVLVTVDWDRVDYMLPWNKEIVVQVVAENDQPSLVTQLYSFYTPIDIDAPTFKSFAPAQEALRVTTGSGLYFEIEDLVSGIDLTTLVIEMDKGATRAWETVYSGGSFQGSFGGTVVEATPGDPSLIEVTIDPPGLPVDAATYLRVTVSDYAENEASLRYWIRTVDVALPIEPVYPEDTENLVSTGENIAIGFEFEDPLTATVDGVLAYDDSLVPKFRNGWGGFYLDDATGKRLILEPPADFALNSNIPVNVTTASYVKNYVFRVATEQVTSTGDALQPKILDADATNIWIGYLRGGNLILRKGNPLTPETTVIPASQWDQGYDPDLGKYVLYWVDNGRVFFSTADPGDSPVGLPQPSTANASVTMGLAGSERIKTLERFISATMPEPVFKTRPPTATLSITHPSPDNDADKLTGFNLYSTWHGTDNLLIFIPDSAEDPFDYSLPASLHSDSSVFFIRPVYDRAGVIFEGDPSPLFTYPEIAEQIAVAFAGSERLYNLESETFLPLKFFTPNDIRVGLAGSDRVESFEHFSYENLKISLEGSPDTATVGLAGSDRISIVLIGGFGIIGVG